MFDPLHVTVQKQGDPLQIDVMMLIIGIEIRDAGPKFGFPFASLPRADFRRGAIFDLLQWSGGNVWDPVEWFLTLFTYSRWQFVACLSLKWLD